MLRRIVPIGSRQVCRANGLSGLRPMSGGTPSRSEEDREDLERERALREKFARKIVTVRGAQEGMNTTASSPNFFAPEVKLDPLGRTRYQGVPFLMLFAFTLLLLPLALLQQSIQNMNGLPWHELPILTSAYYLLIRTVCSRSQQRQIEKDYTEASHLYPDLTFDRFIIQHYPCLFQGHRTSQQEVAAAVAVCLTKEKSISFIQTMRRAAGMASDPKAAVDRIMDALRKKYPHVG